MKEIERRKHNEAVRSMFTEKIFNKLVTICRKQIHLPDSGFKHFSFLMDGKKQVSFGWNLGFKTSPEGARWGHRFAAQHSEIMCIRNFPYSVHELNQYLLVNIRLNKMFQPALSKPCKFCVNFLNHLGINQVIYSDNNQYFQSLR